MFLLASYRKIYPKATRYECIAFLWRSYSRYLPVPRVYSLKDITEAENAIGINRKKGSTTANQVFMFRNRYKRYRYWTMNYPYGIADIRRDDMIDVDEAGIKLEHANRRMGKAAFCGRVHQRGNYGHGENHTLKMAISGDPKGHRWVRFDTAGTDAISFAALIESILKSLPPGTPGNRTLATVLVGWSVGWWIFLSCCDVLGFGSKNKKVVINYNINMQCRNQSIV
mmetsp:Transcript_20666/g.57401  ORF Transcript_20666/g.57401 Transcript_20666/m.57401 type:complete len:226 (+) Transcript_20666:546-1223(+)